MRTKIVSAKELSTKSLRASDYVFGTESKLRFLGHELRIKRKKEEVSWALRLEGWRIVVVEDIITLGSRAGEKVYIASMTRVTNRNFDSSIIYNKELYLNPITALRKLEELYHKVCKELCAMHE